MKSKIPSYKSTFYKFIKPDDREATESTKDVYWSSPERGNSVALSKEFEYKNVIKPLSFFSINEIYVSKYITNIPNYCKIKILFWIMTRRATALIISRYNGVVE